MRTLNFSILFVFSNFNKFPSSDFRVHWNARNSERRTRKWQLPSSLKRGISLTLKNGTSRPEVSSALPRKYQLDCIQQNVYLHGTWAQRPRASHRSRVQVKCVNTVTGQLADAIGDFACLVFIVLAASARPRVVQSASWQSASCPVTVNTVLWQLYEYSCRRTKSPALYAKAGSPVWHHLRPTGIQNNVPGSFPKNSSTLRRSTVHPFPNFT